ncbi:MAG: NADH:ubiquinone reductase (Na(+)-transporting) subunit C [Bacteroidetes bacterium GWC2_33_15]|nr:MAG: NADH:ubiquinone reductase (Na(+)-transporting) subunit C [Bacteroidetes bacterium GWA2_33_15]OFX49573.1 MAG: NADH:ubiquinone reductase (Na(+)-transporting) subunit C [Bacteroidetes bacterium GWC2_33_15]OFX63588.1 MAG: NADH:ubiquinone reductase (Na(+)-transporting) subunit C [Bacteroidetes bacterium GWB2_32_14]OFX68801.1 MAG: NADH:ubiquinone reductase (Na(+)-transporting) subunit C [Bacteroidetes bacterium GWD2_33_33]HAN17606.1 NADH:ubiquinone reductase (Na(+)-transporting) subunit C [Ba
MKSFSNTYIFLFSSGLVILVAALLSIAAIVLQPFQKKNVEINNKQNILTSVNIETTAKTAEELFSKYIIESYVISPSGLKKEGIDAFTIDMKKELAKPVEERNLPIFVSSIDNETQYIIPVYGKGLWGPIWGYVSLNSDLSTIYGANFAHKGETPGLGAEIDKKEFQAQFIGKQIFNESGLFVSVSVLKGGTADPYSKYEVDGISGGTITSKGVDAMLKDCLSSYESYFKILKK